MKKIIGILISILLISSILPITSAIDINEVRKVSKNFVYLINNLKISSYDLTEKQTKICITNLLNISSSKTLESQKVNKLNNGMKTIFMKADCYGILLYKVWWYPVHISSFWFTSKYAYLCFFIEKEFVLKINGIDQEVELPAMVIPWNYVGFGPVWPPEDPCDGNVTLRGICNDVIIKPIYNN